MATWEYTHERIAQPLRSDAGDVAPDVIGPESARGGWLGSLQRGGIPARVDPAPEARGPHHGCRLEHTHAGRPSERGDTVVVPQNRGRRRPRVIRKATSRWKYS
jgi:hypothetical protein